jgi:hypothetical protein
MPTYQVAPLDVEAMTSRRGRLRVLCCHLNRCKRFATKACLRGCLSQDSVGRGTVNRVCARPGQNPMATSSDSPGNEIAAPTMLVRRADRARQIPCSCIHTSALSLDGFREAITSRVGQSLVSLLCVLIWHCGSPLAQETRSQVFVNFALQAPSYSDPYDVGRHGAFAIVLARLLEQRGSQQCAVSSEVDFPDLRLSLNIAPSSRSAQPCLAKIQQTALGGSFDETEFRAAVQSAIVTLRPISLESGDFRGRNLWSTRLRVVGEQALKQLYIRDTTLQPLLTIYDHLTSEGSDFGAFQTWLEKQRASNRLGFYPVFYQAVIGDWDGDISTPSTRPAPRRVEMGESGEIQVRAPNIGARSFVLVRCASVRDSCIQRIARAFCFKTADEIGAPTRSSQIDSHSALRCRPISALGVSGWMIAESDDEAMVRWLRKELASRQLEAFELGDVSIEYVVLVSTT